jgi:hypothetical protein
MFRLFNKAKQRRKRINRIKRKGIDAEKIREDNRAMQIASIQWQRCRDAAKYLDNVVPYFD